MEHNIIDIHKLAEKYKVNIVLVKNYDEKELCEVEEAPLGTLVIDYYTGEGHIKQNDDFFNEEMNRMFKFRKKHRISLKDFKEYWYKLMRVPKSIINQEIDSDSDTDRKFAEWIESLRK